MGRPGKPTDNTFIEFFNGKLRSEGLQQNWFASLTEAKEKLETHRKDHMRHLTTKRQKNTQKMEDPTV